MANNTDDVGFIVGNRAEAQTAGALLAGDGPAVIAASYAAACAEALDGALARGARRARIARRSGTRPLWYALAEELHAGPVAGLASDAAVALGCFTAFGQPSAAAGFVAGAALAGTYRHRDVVEAQGIGWLARRFFAGVTGAALVASAAGWTVARALAVAGVVGAAVLAVRAIAWLVVAAARQRGVGLRPVLVVGSAAGAKVASRLLEVHPEAGLGLAATAELDGGDWPAGLVAATGASHVLVCPDTEPSLVPGILADARRACAAVGALVPHARFATNPGVARIGDVGVLALGSRRPPGWEKRAFDVVVALVGLVVSLPVFVLVAAAIRLDDGGPVFYRQRRVGRDHRLFRIWKFRSMVVGAEALEEQLRAANMHSGLLFKIDNDPRVTRVGRILRRFHLDELPQLFNVIAGDMSLVGPRPLPVDPGDFDGPARLRHRVRPGITGPWQVLGGNALDYDEMIELDLAYVATWSFTTDLRLLAGTLGAVLARRPRA